MAFEMFHEFDLPLPDAIRGSYGGWEEAQRALRRADTEIRPIYLIFDIQHLVYSI
jgi:hypothetical protein